MKPKTVTIDTDFLLSLMKVKGLNESEFAQAIGVAHPTVNRVMNGKRGAGNKFIHGILSAFPDVSYNQLIKHEDSLPKGNRSPKKTA